MNYSWTSKDLEIFAEYGIALDAIEQQIQNFKNGFPKSKLIHASSVTNGEIVRLTDKDIDEYCNIYEIAQQDKNILKFVPASGAATRMFKDLFEFSSKYFGIDYNIPAEYPSVKEFIQHIRSFAFFNDLESCMQKFSMDITDYMNRGDFASIINFLLKDQYLGYGSMPKALIKFHKYGDSSRTALEEHIVEGAEYALSKGRKLNLHFTISPEHRKMFNNKIDEVRSFYQKTLDIALNITLSEQQQNTNTIAVDEYNNPVRDEHEKIILRQSGHGALLENLNKCHADIIFIKNIDNVVPDWMKHTTTVYKKALGGMLLKIQQQCFEYIDAIQKNTCKNIETVEQFIANTFHYTPSTTTDAETKKQELLSALDRPIRVCGMVRNQGEPGGGPFMVVDGRGNQSLQIVEVSQINTKQPDQKAILDNATHFNPVDIVCSTKRWNGKYFDLHGYVDNSTGFITKKSIGARTIKSQELPGLWNGSMAYWNTVFVEVPLATFNPVKTVNDLLRDVHLEH